MTLAAAPSRAAGGGPRAEGLTLTGSALTQLRAAVVAAPRGAERLRLTVAADAGAPLAWLRAVPARVPAAYFAGRDGDGEVLGGFKALLQAPDSVSLLDLDQLLAHLQRSVPPALSGWSSGLATRYATI